MTKFLHDKMTVYSKHEYLNWIFTQYSNDPQSNEYSNDPQSNEYPNEQHS